MKSKGSLFQQTPLSLGWNKGLPDIVQNRVNRILEMYGTLFKCKLITAVFTNLKLSPFILFYQKKLVMFTNTGLMTLTNFRWFCPYAICGTFLQFSSAAYIHSAADLLPRVTFESG